MAINLRALDKKQFVIGVAAVSAVIMVLFVVTLFISLIAFSLKKKERRQ